MAAQKWPQLQQPAEGDPVGLAAQVVAGPPPGGHDQRVHPAELGGERLVQQPLAGRAPVLGVGAGAPHQGVIGGGRAGQVHPVDVRVVGQVRTHLRAALDDGQPAGVDELDEHPLECRAQVGVDRVELHHDRAAVPEQQAEGIHARQAVEVAGRQQQGHARVRELPGCQAVTGSRHLSGCGARLQPDPARVAHEQQPIGARRREHLDRDPALRVLAHGTGRHEALVAGQPGQGRLPPADQDRQPGLPEPHITHPEAVRFQALSLPPRLDHPWHLVAEPPAQPMHQPAPSPPPAGRPRTAAQPAPSPRRHPAPQHPVLRPSGSSVIAITPSMLARAPCPGCSTTHATPGTAAGVEADVPGDPTAPDCAGD